MRLRPAHAGDAAALAVLHNASLPQCWSESDFLAWIQDARYRVWVAEQGTQIIGYAAVRVVAGEAEILGIAVEAARRRGGTGRQLLAALLTDSAISRCFLEVSRENQAALRLYEALGFTALGVRLHYYADGTDALAMQWVRG